MKWLALFHDGGAVRVPVTRDEAVLVLQFIRANEGRPVAKASELESRLPCGDLVAERKWSGRAWLVDVRAVWQPLYF
jgi:hypothetical protein